MPEKTQSIAVNGYDAATLTAIAYGTLEQLKWNIKFAGENILVAYTPRSAFRWDMEITVQATDNQITVNSKSIHGELMDLPGRNQKNINQFAAAFENVKPTADEQSIQTWNKKIARLQQDTIKVAGEEVKQAEEIDKVMNLSSGNLYVTYGIIGINVLVFIIMIIDGAGLFDPNGIVHIKWGSNYSPLTYAGDWWRLLSSNYIHFGIIHLAMNMYALYNIGMFLEPMMGKKRYLIAYTCTGVLASLVSLWWHKEGVNSAGASGAIFGMIGLLLAFIVTKYIPATIRKGLLQSVGIMAVYSLVYGMKGGVDNAAHIGGLVTGFVIGWLYWLTLKKEGSPLSANMVSIVIVSIAAAASFFFLQNKKLGTEERKRVEKEILDAGFTGAEKFRVKYNEFVELNDKAIAVVNDNNISNEDFMVQAKQVAYPSWEKAVTLLTEMDKLNISENDHQKAKLLLKYVAQRKEELQAREELINNPLGPAQKRLEEIIGSINQTMEEFQKLQSPG